MRLYFWYFTTCFLLVSCVNQNPSPVEYNHNNDYSYNHYEKKINSKRDDVSFIHDDKMVTSSDSSSEEKIVSRKLHIKQDKMEHPEGILIDQHKKNTNIVKAAQRISKPATINFQEKPIQKIVSPIEKNLNDDINPARKFIKPVEGKIISKFGEDSIFGKNKGMNIEAQEGDDVKSVASGEIIYAGVNKNFGNLIIVKLTDSNKYVAYAHLNDLIVSKNKIITLGEIIGHVGNTGKAPSPQLYIAMKIGNKAVDPMNYIEF